MAVVRRGNQIENLLIIVHIVVEVDVSALLGDVLAFLVLGDDYLEVQVLVHYVLIDELRDTINERIGKPRIININEDVVLYKVMCYLDSEI